MAQAPTATTGAAGSIGTDTAVVSGTVNANGASTTVVFEVGTSSGTYDLGEFTAAQSPVTGSTNTAVTAVLSELSINSTYYYRVKATNASGTTYGTELTFDTLGLPPTATTSIATGVAAPNATLNGFVNDNGSDTTVEFEYGTTTAYGATATADQSPITGGTGLTAVTGTISSISAGTVYHFRVKATNAGGTSYGEDRTFIDGVAAPVVTTEAATAVTGTSAVLRGIVNAGNQSTGVTFEYGTSASYGTTVTADQSPVGGTADTIVSYTISGLTPGATYHYRVVGSNVSGTVNGSDMTFTTTPDAPTATTNGATSISGTGATLNGTVNASGSSTVVTFEYGTTVSYGTTVTATQSPVTGSTDTAVSRAITGLTLGTTYHYRVVAVSAGGTAVGGDMTFTAGTAPSATTSAATSIGTTSATFNGTVNANGSSTNVTFEYGPTASYGRTVVATQSPVTGSTNTAVSATPTDLLPGTTYHFRVKAQSIGGTDYGADMTFTTAAAPIVATNAATSVTATGAALNGTVNANGSSTTVTFEYGTTTAYGTTVTADQSPVTGSTNTAVSTAITGLVPGTTYHYRVVGTNTNGTSNGADMTFFTSAPAAPIATTVAASLITSDSAVLNGTVNANNASTTVTFEWGPASGAPYANSVPAAPSPFSGTTDTPVSAAITGLTLGNTYFYRVVATNADGTTNGAEMSFTTVSTPTAETGSATNITATSATLNGVFNANNRPTVPNGFQYGPSVAYGFYAYNSTTLYGGNTDTPASAGITGLTPNTTYHFRAFAMDGSPGPLYYGLDVTFTTALAPTATTNAATSVGSTTATINGTVNAGDASSSVYFEYGGDTNYGTTLLAQPATVTGTADTPVSLDLSGLIPNTTYHFRVTIQNANGSAVGADMTLTTGPAPPTATTDAATGVTSTGATLNGLVNPSNAITTVTFEYGTTIAYGTAVTAAQSPLTGTGSSAVSAAITGLTVNTTYHYRAVAQNAEGTAYGSDMTFFTGTAPPTVTTGAATGAASTGATLNGTVNANNGDTAVTFQLGLDTSYGATYTAAQSPVTGSTDTAVSYNVTGLAGNTTYHYRAVGQNTAGTTYGADMTFTTSAAGAPTVTTTVVTNITDTSARSGGNVTDEGGAAVTARGVCWSTSTGPTIAGSRTSNGTGTGAFTSNITGLSGSTTYFVRAYATNTYGTVYGAEYTFTTNTPGLSVSITNPANGDTVSGTVAISATTTPATVSKVEFYIDGSLIAEDATAPYEALWDTTGYGDGSYTIMALATNSLSQRSRHRVTVTVSNDGGGTPEIQLSRDQLNFGSDGTYTTSAQTILIENTGTGTLNWVGGTDTSWLSISPGSGSGGSVLAVSVNPSGLSAGAYSGTVTISDSNATNSPQTISVDLTVYGSGGTAVPFGHFSTPVNGTTVASSVPVTGWALDDIEVTSVKIYRNAMPGESGGMVYIGDADFVEGARPDVEAMYPDYPLNDRAGWGYMMLTSFLPDATYTLYAKATDKEGNTVTLGSKSITIDNGNAVKPFGAIDTPTQGGTASGSAFVNFGWVLTPQPNTIPTDGSTIFVWVDGVKLGNPVYNQYREDIATFFPGYNNSNGAVGYFFLDTTAYANGVHTIHWTATDDGGNTDGIGSRFFTILNTGSSRAKPDGIAAFPDAIGRIGYLTEYPGETVRTRNRLDRDFAGDEMVHEENGAALLTIKELEPVELSLGENVNAVRGYMKTDNGLNPLPIGTTLDYHRGTFHWAPVAGFFGQYQFVFVIKTPDGNFYKKSIEIDIIPRY